MSTASFHMDTIVLSTLFEKPGLVPRELA